MSANTTWRERVENEPNLDRKESEMKSGKTKSNVVRINAYLRSLKREERLVRGRGYYYVMGGTTGEWPATAIYTYNLNDWAFNAAVEEVASLFDGARMEAVRSVAHYMREELKETAK